ncbi:MAG: LemA family protein [Alphaproteobacteria bacterium]|nr:LemA family protein [Alphaproteobacteria bacterium]
METWMILLGVIVVLILWVVMAYNGLVGGRNQCQASWRQIDVQLKRRHDLVPNLVESVKDAMSYEQETLRQVIEARNAAVTAGEKAAAGGSKADAIAAENQLTQVLTRFFALSEAYPQLRANENVSRLMEELTTTENRIAFARQHYNDSVLSYNNRVQMFPGNLIAGSFNFRIEEYFQVPEAEAKPVKVDLRPG